jgi:hypothetical protein
MGLSSDAGLRPRTRKRICHHGLTFFSGSYLTFCATYWSLYQVSSEGTIPGSAPTIP